MVIEVKKDGQWIKIPYITADVPVYEAPVDGKQYARKDGNWSEVVIPDVDLTDYATKTYVDTEIETINNTISGLEDTNTTYTFVDGINSFTVTPSNGTAQTVLVTPSIDNASTSANGLMSSTDKAKLDIIQSYTTRPTITNLSPMFDHVYITLSGNGVLSCAQTGAEYNGRSIHVVATSSSACTITLPTTGNYMSMSGSSVEVPAGGSVEINLICMNGIWRIAVLEQS